MRDRLGVVPGSDVFLGLDISSVSWHVTARSGGETLLSASFPPKREALNGLLGRLEGCRVHSVYETGPFGYGLHDWLRSRQVDSIVVSAAHVPGEIGNRVKTDRRDGLKLARTLEAGLLRPIFVPEARQRADRELVRQRHRVQRHRCAAMARIKSFFLTYDIEVPEEAGTHWGGDFEAWLRGLKLADQSLDRVLEEQRGLYFDLDARVDGLTKELRQMARSSDYAPMVELLSTVPGIGWLTARTLVVENQGSPRGKTCHRGRRAQILPPPPRHRAERSALPSQLQPNEGELSSRRAIETLPGGGNRVVSRDPRTVVNPCCGAAPDPNKRPVASTTNRMLKLLALP
jgi:transposase